VTNRKKMGGFWFSRISRKFPYSVPPYSVLILFADRPSLTDELSCAT